eukprot:Pgem_evm1s3896
MNKLLIIHSISNIFLFIATVLSIISVFSANWITNKNVTTNYTSNGILFLIYNAWQYMSYPAFAYKSINGGLQKWPCSEWAAGFIILIFAQFFSVFAMLTGGVHQFNTYSNQQPQKSQKLIYKLALLFSFSAFICYLTTVLLFASGFGNFMTKDGEDHGCGLGLGPFSTVSKQSQVTDEKCSQTGTVPMDPPVYNIATENYPTHSFKFEAPTYYVCDDVNTSPTYP